MPMSGSNIWGTDVPISVPLPKDHSDAVTVSFHGLAFTPLGLAFEVNEAVYEETYTSRYAPAESDG